MRTRDELIRSLERDRIAHTVARAGDGWMVVTPSLGARILGTGIGGENVLWTAPAFLTRGWSEGGNAGGARTWIAPEAGSHGFFFSANGANWDVPRELDPGDYRPVPADEGWIAFRNVFTARSADGASFPVAITRSMRIEKLTPVQACGLSTGLRIRFRHEVENCGTTAVDRRLGLWCIVQVPSERPGTILIPVRDEAPPECVRAYFGEVPPGVLRTTRGTVLLKALGGHKYKIGVPADAASGRIAFVRPARVHTGPPTRWTLLSLEFPVDPGASYLDKPSYEPAASGSNGDAIHAYSDPGRGDLAFSEIEAHAPAVRLAPRQRQSFEIGMTIAAGPEHEIMDCIRCEVAREVMPLDLSW